MRLFIQKNRRQDLAAKIAAASFIKNGFNKENISFLDFEESKLLKSFVGKKYLRSGKIKYFKDDLQSFTFLRFLAPEAAGYKGKILVIDPDVFAIKKIDDWDKFSMNDYNLACTFLNNKPRSEVMIINAETVNWNFKDILEKVFKLQLDYSDLMNLSFDKKLRFKELKNSFNSLDKIEEDTILLHTTDRITQPWKEGLKIDFEIHQPKYYILKQYIKKYLGKKYDYKVASNVYLKHKDEKVISIVKQYFKFAIENKLIKENEIQESLKNNWISPNFIKD